MVLDLDASGETLESDRAEVSKSTGPGVNAIDFSPDGGRLVSGSSDGFVRTWDLGTGERLSLLRGHRSTVLAVRWHPRFSWIVSSDDSGSIRFWEADSGRSLDVLRGHDEDVHALGFSALGDRLLSASRDTTLRVWDGQAGANDTILEGYDFPNFRPYRLAFSPDGERIVWRSGRAAFAVTDARTGEELSSFWSSGPFSTRALSFSEGGVWECGFSGRLTRWDPQTGGPSFAVETGWAPSGCAFEPGGRAALVGGLPHETGGTTRVPGLIRVDLATGAVRWKTNLPFYPGLIRSSPDGSRCLIAFASSTTRGLACIETSSGSLLWQMPGLPRSIGLEFFPDGARFAHTTYNEWDNSLYIRSVETGELLNTLSGHAQPTPLDISPDGTRIVTGNWDGTISLWSPERGEILVLPGHGRYTARVGFSPDGQTIASLGPGGGRRLWNASPVELRQPARQAAARRRRWSVDARRRVDELLTTRVHRDAVVAALEADSSLRPEQRTAAILLARSDPVSIDSLAARSAAISVFPGRSGAEYMAALEGAARILDLTPSLSGAPAQVRTEVAPKAAAVHDLIALARIRLGLMREALADLERAERILASGVSWGSPTTPLLRAMAHHHLGDAQSAAREYELGVRVLADRNPERDPRLEALARALELELRELLERD